MQKSKGNVGKQLRTLQAKEMPKPNPTRHKNTTTPSKHNRQETVSTKQKTVQEPDDETSTVTDRQKEAMPRPLTQRPLSEYRMEAELKALCFGQCLVEC